MLYTVKLSTNEEDLLSGLFGQPLESITTNGWSVEIRTASQTLQCAPEEVATPDKAHRSGDVERPQIQVIAETMPQPQDHVLARDLGKVKVVNVISILVSFSPVSQQPAVTLPNGGVIPASLGYGWIYYQPSTKQAVMKALGDDQALIELDRAFEIVTEKYSNIVIYAQGFSVQASLAGLPNEDWANFKSYSRQVLPRFAPPNTACSRRAQLRQLGIRFWRRAFGWVARG